MSFIPPMLATRLTDPSRLQDPRYIAEPKLDGQRAQVHVHDGRTLACYSHLGRDLLRHAGFAWLLDLGWPVQQAVFDGEAVAGTATRAFTLYSRSAGVPAARWSSSCSTCFSSRAKNAMREPRTARRKRLEHALSGPALARVTLVPVSGDTLALWDTWVGIERGLVLKDRSSI